jgi:hypothetical protein
LDSAVDCPVTKSFAALSRGCVCEDFGWLKTEVRIELLYRGIL